MRPMHNQNRTWRGDNNRNFRPRGVGGPVPGGYRPQRPYRFSGNAPLRFRQPGPNHLPPRPVHYSNPYHTDDYHHDRPENSGSSSRMPYFRHDSSNHYNHYTHTRDRTRPSRFQTDQNPMYSRRTDFHEQPNTTHRPPASDHYQNDKVPTERNADAYKHTFNDTVDLVKKRLQNRKDSTGDVSPSNVSDLNEEQTLASKQTSSTHRKHKKRIRSHSSTRSKTESTQKSDEQCASAMKETIVEQLFKMDRSNLQKLVEDPHSSSKFEYAIHSLITESRNSLNRHLRSAAERSLQSEVDLSSNDQIYEDTFMKQMQCILNPEDAITLTDIKPFVLAELSKVLQFDCSEQIQDDYYPQADSFENFQSTADDNQYYDVNNEKDINHINHTEKQEEHSERKPFVINEKHSHHSHQRSYPHRHSSHTKSESISHEGDISQEYSDVFEDDIAGDITPVDPNLFDRKAYIRLNPEQTFDNFTDDEDPFLQRDVRSPCEDKNVMPPGDFTGNNLSWKDNSTDQWQNNSIGSALEKLIKESDIHDIKPEMSLPENEFEPNQIATELQGDFDLIDYVDNKAEENKQDTSNSSKNEEQSDKSKSKSSESSKTHKQKKDSRNQKTSKHSEGNKAAHRKEKRKKTDDKACRRDSQNKVLNKNIIINVNDCPSIKSDSRKSGPKSVFNLFFSKNNESRQEKSSKKEKNSKARKSSSSTDKKPEDKNSPIKIFDMFEKAVPKKDWHIPQKPGQEGGDNINPPKTEVKIFKEYKEKENSIFGRIKKRQSSGTQTVSNKLFSRSSQTMPAAEKRVSHTSTQTDNIAKDKSKATDVMERMKEIDLEIQSLIQEKFILYNNLEKKDQQMSEMQNFGMAVLSVDHVDVCDENEIKIEKEDEIEILNEKIDGGVKKSSPESIIKPTKKSKINSVMQLNDSHIIKKPQEKTTVQTKHENFIKTPKKCKQNLHQNSQKFNITECFVILEKLSSETISQMTKQGESNVTKQNYQEMSDEFVQYIETDSDDTQFAMTKVDDPILSSSAVIVETIEKAEEITEELIAKEKPIKIESADIQPAEEKVTRSKRKRKTSEKVEPSPRIYEKRLRKQTEKAAAMQESKSKLKETDASQIKPLTRSRVKRNEQVVEVVYNNNDEISDYVPGMCGIELQDDSEDISTEIIVDGSFDIDRPLLVKNLEENVASKVIDEAFDDASSIITDDSQTTNHDSLEQCRVYDFSTEDTRCDTISVTGHDDAIIAIEPIRDNFLAASTDGNVYYFNGLTGKLISTLRGSNLPVTCVNVVEDMYDTTVYTGSLDSRLRYYNLETGLEKGLEVNVLSPISSMDRAWDTIFVGTKTGFVLQFECKNNYMLIPVSSVKFSEQAILALKALKEGPRKVLLVAARSENVTIKDAQTGLLLRTLEGPKMTVYSLLFEVGMVFCGTSSHQIQVFDYTSGTNVGVHNGGKGAICLKSAGGFLFAGCYDGCVYIYKHNEEQPVAVLRGPSVMLLSLHVVNSKVVVGYKDKSLFIWKIPATIVQQMVL